MSGADKDELPGPIRAPYGAGHDRAGPGHPIDDVLPGEARVLAAAHESLAGDRRGLRGLWPFLGPNMAAGAEFGFLLLWVVVVANLMAMLVQSMSAKLGIATRRNLPELCRERFPAASASCCGFRRR